jgi:hypothetical protein
MTDTEYDALVARCIAEAGALYRSMLEAGVIQPGSAE